MRRLTKVWRRAGLMLPKPVVFTLLVYASWRLARMRWGHLFPSGDAQVAMTGAGFALIFHALVATRVFGRVTSERDQMFLYAEYKEFVKFVYLRDKPIEWFTHWILAALAAIALLGMGVVRYESLITGTVMICGAAFFIAIFWQAAWVADNIVKSQWLDEEKWFTPELRTMTLAEARERQERTRADHERMVVPVHLDV